MNVYELAELHKQQIVSRDRVTLTRLASSYNGIRERLETQLAVVLSDIESARARGETPGVSWLYRHSRYESLLNQARGEVTKFSADTEQAVTIRQAEETRYAEENMGAQVRRSLGPLPSADAARVFEGINRLPTRVIERMVVFTGNGKPLSRLLSSLGDEASTFVQNALIEGVASGHNPRVIARNVREAFGGNLSRALTVTRTETMRAYREASREVYRENPQVVKGWRWLATLGPRTCACCIAMHGTEHTVEEVLDGHPNCRCTQFPIVPTWEELGFKSVAPEPDPFGVTGEQWFASRSAAYQREVLGPLGMREYQSGTPLREWVGRRDSRAWGTMRYQRSLREVSSNPPIDVAFSPVK